MINDYELYVRLNNGVVYLGAGNNKFLPINCNASYGGTGYDKKIS